MNTNKYSLNQLMKIRYMLTLCCNGAKRIVKNRSLLLLTLTYHICVVCGLVIIHTRVTGPLASMYHFLYTAAFILVTVIIAVILLWVLGMPTGYLRIMQHMHRVGLTNAAGEVPVFVSRSLSKDNPNLELWEFETYGVPFSSWDDYTEKLESGLDIAVIKIEQGTTERRVVMKIIPHPAPWPECIPWHNDLLPRKKSMLALGDNRCEQILVNLSVIPHFLIAGRTGSGKSVLMKLLMLQSLLKGMSVIIVDYKGGIDYSREWPNYCEIVLEDDSFLAKLTELLEIMRKRMDSLRTAKVVNIDKYNESCENHMERICLFVDEVAECLDKTGASPERKKIIGAIEHSLSNLCRLGRAVGIHVFLGLQRGSADILSGQIRNNTYKILGSADENLSILTLGTADAAKRIPKDVQGRFMDEADNMFQAYYSDFDTELFKDVPRKEKNSM